MITGKEHDILVKGINTLALDMSRWTYDGKWMIHDTGIMIRIVRDKSTHHSLEVCMDSSDVFMVEDAACTECYNLFEYLKYMKLKSTIDKVIAISALSIKDKSPS